MQKLKSILILVIILISLIPVYSLNKYLVKTIQPRISIGRLFLYILSVFAAVFVYTFLIVFLLKKLFPGA